MIVIKVGGGEGINYDYICEDIAQLVRNGEKIVLVHGGSYEANVLSEKLGKPPQFVTSISGYESRYTDRETLEIIIMVYSGKANKMIVEKFQKLGVNAVGLSGIDGRILEGKKKSVLTIIEDGKKKVLRGDNTGKVENVNVDLLKILLNNGYLPVIAPLSSSYEGEAINVDGDRAAALIAVKLNADKLIILSNVPGLLEDVKDESTLIKHIEKDKINEFMEYAKRRMKKKVMGAEEAIKGGVKEIVFADARIMNPVSNAINGKGTVIN